MRRQNVICCSFSLKPWRHTSGPFPAAGQPCGPVHRSTCMTPDGAGPMGRFSRMKQNRLLSSGNSDHRTRHGQRRAAGTGLIRASFEGHVKRHSPEADHDDINDEGIAIA